jgi:hypothetical protein
MLLHINGKFSMGKLKSSVSLFLLIPKHSNKINRTCQFYAGKSYLTDSSLH